jgi:hypothetical protein
MPTQIGDVLILYKDGNPIHVLGLVSEDGQQTAHSKLIHEAGPMAAITTARNLVIRGRRIYIKNIATGWWRTYMKNTDTGWWVRLK